MGTNAYTPSAIGTGAGAGTGIGGLRNFTPDPSLPEGMVGTMGGTGFDPETGRMDLGTAGGSGYYSSTGTTGAPGTMGIASQYMNPYLQSVLQPQLEEMRRQSQINLQPGLAKMTQAGGYGGGRQAIMESEANRNLLQEQNKTIGQGYSNAYDRAMGQFNTEQGQAKTLADMLAGAGAQQRSQRTGATRSQKLSSFHDGSFSVVCSTSRPAGATAHRCSPSNGEP
jgi:hypothetical protein